MKPKQLFTTNAITREQIAGHLNDAIDLENWNDYGKQLVCTRGPETVAKNDRRLTDRVCRNFAMRFGDIVAESFDEDTENDAIHDLSMKLLKQLGFRKVDRDAEEDD